MLLNCSECPTGAGYIYKVRFKIYVQGDKSCNLVLKCYWRE